MNNRPNQYDWFKGKQQQKKTPKSTAKNIWKFTKIFIYLALFVFTMTGCVQVFVIKTDNTLGNGVEFYLSEDEISPHVTKFNLKHSTTDKGKDIYSLNIDGKNPVWVNDKNDLDEIRKELTNNQGLGSLKDAYKGRNEAISIQGSGAYHKQTWDNKHSVNKLNGKIATWSTEMKNNPSISLPNITISNLGIRYIFNNNKTAKIDFGIFANPNTPKEKAQVLALNTFMAQELSDGKGNQNKNTSTIYNFLNSNLSKSKTTSNSQTKVQESAQDLLQTIFSYSGIDVMFPSYNPNGDSLVQISFIKDFTPGTGTGSTSYRPMVTWGDAWKRGPFYGIFVYPLSKLTNLIIGGLGDMNGWEMVITIFIVVWMIRALTFALSFKSMLQQQKMQEMQGKKAVIDAKYAAYKGNKQMEMRKNQEIQELYKKEGVSMFGSMGSIFLTMPFFLAIWRVIGAIPHIKAANWLGISFPAKSWKELFAGQVQYLPLLIFAAIFAASQSLFPRLLTWHRDKQRINVQQKAAMKKNNRMQNIMTLVFIVMAVIFNAGLQIYWIAGGIWMLGQSYATHRIIIRQSKRRKKIKVKA